MYKVALYNSVVAVVLNVVLALVFSQFATNKQKTPTTVGGPKNLGYFDQIMHMFVHHEQTLLTSSLIIFNLVFLSTIIANMLVLRIM